ncbi:peptide/nickel transport system permease protein [Stella humosa]|uniref:Peptide/nickel transport system permease protein n=1 Tax=Stella humosa TaxID=94 RepID=A0A3N1MFQ6_9PROT|nr:ABC transporter permease [Stella humosa]ROQ00026.1 peptide/nickel transport system permease protein [Stella humosa]BBK30742.1 peptide ABC transporter permease [Stella humosa]
MLTYILRRIGLAGLMLFGLVCLTFVIANIAPSDPAALAAGPDAGRSQIEQARREYGLDRPLHEQFLRYVGDLTRLEFGRSIATGRPVGADLARYFPATLELCIVAMIIGLVLGVPLGILSALYKDGPIDHFTRIFAVTGVALPPFWFGLLLQLAFAAWLGWLPTSGRLSVFTEPADPITGLLLVDSLMQGNGGMFVEAASYMALPALVLSFPCLAQILRVNRSEMVEALRADYIVAARAHGVRPGRIVVVHALKNAMLPTLAIIGLRWGWMISSTVLVETVFDWPGTGLYAVSSAIAGDFKPVMGVTLIVGLNFMIANLLVDLMYGVLDPRLRSA